MSSRIDIIQRLITDRGRAEHIEIKGGPRHSGAMLEQPHRITRRFRMESRLHGCSTELAILEGCYLRVHSTRSRSELRKYELDLRYVTSRPVRVRRIAWLWLLTTSAFSYSRRWEFLEPGPKVCLCLSRCSAAPVRDVPASLRWSSSCVEPRNRSPSAVNTAWPRWSK